MVLDACTAKLGVHIWSPQSVQDAQLFPPSENLLVFPACNAHHPFQNVVLDACRAKCLGCTVLASLRESVDIFSCLLMLKVEKNERSF